MRTNVSIALLMTLFAVAAQSEPAAPRRPRGIYAVVNVNTNIDDQKKINPSITNAQLRTFFRDKFHGLLQNPAVAGIALQIGWSVLNPRPLSDPQPYDWGILDVAFDTVATFPPKQVQILVFPGFFTPQWVLDEIPSCDGLFQSPPKTPKSDCGKATFTGYGEPHGDLSVLPMPWNSVYKSEYATFLDALAKRYESNKAFVSIPVAGPTAASVEMILPTSKDTPDQFGGISPEDMWRALLAFHYPAQPAYQNSDQAFIDEWNAAIDVYGKTFHRLTLVVTTGRGMPNLATTGFTVPPQFTEDCPTPPTMDCAAEVTIQAHFVQVNVDAGSAKATQESGVQADRFGVLDYLGEHMVKRLSDSTQDLKPMSAQILGGLQFTTSVSKAPVDEGCRKKFPPDSPAACTVSCGPGPRNACVPVSCIPKDCLAYGVKPSDISVFLTYGNVPSNDLISPEQGLWNVLHIYFDGTPQAAAFDGTAGTAPLNFLQIYEEDVTYAAANAASPAVIVRGDGTTFSMSFQDLLNLASDKILAMAEPQ